MQLVKKPYFLLVGEDLINLSNVISIYKDSMFFTLTDCIEKPCIKFKTTSGDLQYTYSTEKERDETFNDLTSILAIND